MNTYTNTHTTCTHRRIQAESRVEVTAWTSFREAVSSLVLCTGTLAGCCVLLSLYFFVCEMGYAVGGRVSLMLVLGAILLGVS